MKRIINIIAINVHTDDNMINEDLEFTYNELGNDLSVDNIHAVADKWMTDNWGRHTCIKFGEIKNKQVEAGEDKMDAFFSWLDKVMV